MKRIIVLNIDLTTIPLDANKIKYKLMETELANTAVKTFKSQMKNTNIKPLKDYLPLPEILVEFPDKDIETVYNFLRSLHSVATIDSFLKE
jgi:hypothetical protein